ncbi:uncharacterized protein LOC130990481 [Salvia miltiorrhiza]|uniref:uncharacterized protein LOC130990481 n=1 Tax=Salvia miltiorrhiza TaxID=226208 RepID=UPI0025AC67FB|nr:uncharacterized protein LOC130990481 [Salvia miltiorrhiza]
MEKLESNAVAVGTQMKMFETQLGQLANAFTNLHQQGQFSSNTTVNPKEHCKAINLRSGTTYEVPKMPEDEIVSPVDEKEAEEVTVEVSGKKKNEKQKTTSPATVTLPFPQRHQKERVKQQFSKFLEIFKKLHINLPLVEALQEMPQYAKFLKDIISRKKRLGEFETVNLNEECSAILQKKLPAKLKDPGIFTISCIIGGQQFGKALCDLGASINLMPLSIFQRLAIGEMKPTSIALQMADRSVTYPRGIVEDMLVKVNEFIFPADFVVLDFEEDNTILLILGRPFLATGRALIDVANGELTLRENDESHTFSIYRALKFYDEKEDIDMEECKLLSLVDSYDTPSSWKGLGDPLETCISHFFLSADFDFPLDMHLFSDELFECCSALESVAEIAHRKGRFLELRTEEEKKKMEEEKGTAPKLELKPLPDHLRYAFLGDGKTYPVIVSALLTPCELDSLLRVLRKHKSAIGWSISDLKGISPSVCMHRILLDDDARPRAQPQRRLNPIMQEVVRKEVLKLLDAGIIYAISDSEWVSPTQVVSKKGGMTVVKGESDEMIATRVVTGWRVCIDYRMLNAATRRDHFPLPFIDQMLDRLAGYEFYCFLDGYSGYNQIMIAPEDQDKTAFTCPYGIFAYRRMSFGLCNAPATFQRCMMTIFHDLIESVMEVFMDDFSVFGSSFDHCLENLSVVLARCEETNLVLNWEKCHFMVREGIVLGHKVSAAGLEVDRAKIVAIEKLPPPTNDRAVRSFLGHAGFYRRFIKDFSKVAKPLSQLLEKDVKFYFDDACTAAFETLKKALVTAPVLIVPDWTQPFELMCDASDIAIGAALGQKRDKIFRVIYYASRTLDKAQANYTVTEKEMLAVVYAFDKFRAYLIGTKSIVYTDHVAIRFLFDKKDAKPRLIRWILLLQEFDIEIRDRRGCENVVTDHLSRLENSVEGEELQVPIKETFPDEQILQVSSLTPWYADYVNFLAAKYPPPKDSSTYKKKKFYL